ncbi:porin [Burkholderia guangdongensis]|uniref:porin n=1 Tax=Burkholderia guangdongensis TaxID=1792500 RepID=UPI0015CAD66C|nr:porin [Burkholderia guangdongensis]
MKKAVIAAALAGLSGTAAHAQSSVTLYGVVDMGFEHLTNANAAGQAQNALLSGKWLPSRWGLKGTEDLGGGMKALFMLENGFNANDGSFSSPGVEFNRSAWVGLSSSTVGTLTLGRQYSVQFDKTLFYDPTLFGAYSILSLNLIPVQTQRVNNSVKFKSNEYAGFSAEAMYGFGQQLPGNASAGRYVGAGLEYLSGGFGASASYERTNGSVGAVDQSGLVDQRWSVAARYDFGPVMVSGGMARITGDLHLTPVGSVYWAATKWNATSALSLIGEVGHYRFQQAPGHPTFAEATAQYRLSLRSILYANVGYYNNSGGSAFGVNGYTNVGQLGKSQVGMSVGIQHRF